MSAASQGRLLRAHFFEGLLHNDLISPRGDTGMRIAVNTGLARIYAGDEIVEIYRRWFGQFGRPTALLEAAYALGAIPE